MTDLRTRALLALLMVTTGLAGCIASDEALDPQADQPGAGDPVANLTQAVYEEVTRSSHVVQDEVNGEQTEETWVDIYRPAKADHAVPVILVFTPYQALGDALGAPGMVADGEAPVPPEQSPYDPGLVEFFVPRGYAVAFADVRGNHNSGGCIDQSGPGQWRDGYAVVEFLGTQDWSNGNVGMYGVSYDGETQITTALLNPPHLKTIVPIASVDSQYEYMYNHGVPYELGGAGTMAAYLAISAVPGTDPNAATSYHERFTCQPENLQAALDLSGDWSAYWEDRAYFKLAGQSNVSMLRVHGLADWNVKPDHIDPLTNAWGGEPKRAIYGQWGHATPDRDDWDGQGGILHRWYDHFLYGKDTGIVDALPPVLVEDTEDAWRGIDAFPPRNTTHFDLALSGDGRLAREDAQPGNATIHDYLQGTQGAGADALVSQATTTAGENATGHPAELVFETPPMEEAIVLTGRPTVTFTATTDAESTHWVAHLERVASDGSSEWINRGYQDTRHRNGVDDPAPLTTGEAYELSVEMYPQTDVIQQGEALRLVLTTNDAWVHQDTTYATSTVQLGPSSVLSLPLMPADAVDVPADSLPGLPGSGPAR